MPSSNVRAEKMPTGRADTKKRVLLFYPPGRLYQRGEDRSQGNIEQSSATTVRSPNDMGYAAALLRENYEVYFKDFQTEGLGIDKLREEFVRFKPDVIFLSITNSTIFDDLEVVRVLKEMAPDLVVILKGALFFDPPEELLAQLNLANVDYLIGGESEFVIADLVHAHFNNPAALPTLRGILYRDGNRWVRTDFTSWEEDVDALPLPDRSAINNSLYVRPDTGELQTTIITSRGCPASCIYCLTPTISGQKVRYRSPDDVIAELRDCYHKHGIRNFFFRSDTFTINRDWVRQVCEKIKASELYGKIEWVANSRVRPLAGDTLMYMRDAGCWLIAFGFESGSEETMRKIKKGATTEDNLRAASLAKEADLKVYGFYLIGLPWEDWSHLEDTRRHMFEIDADFIELHIAVPYYGTPLYHLAKEEGLIDGTVLGKNYFNAPTIGTCHLETEEIMRFRKKALLQYHLRPSYIMRRMGDVLRRPKTLKNYAKFGTRVILNNLR